MAEPVAFEDVTCLANGPKAALIQFEDREEWVPFSQIDDDSEVFEKGDIGTILISRWWAEKVGLISKGD